MTLLGDGASLDTRYPEPSIDLATLVECLAESIPVPAAAPAGKPYLRRPLLTWSEDERALGIDTPAALLRVWRAAASKRLRAERIGLLRDTPVPRGRARAHVGGRVVPGTEGRLRQATDRLVAAVDAAIDEAERAGFPPRLLEGELAERVLDPLARRLHRRLEEFVRGETRVARVAFAPVGTTQQARGADVARVMAAVEELDGDRAACVARFASAVRALLQDRGYSSREVEAAVRYHAQRAEEPGTQLARFFDFLEDDAMARIRLQVASRMMEALADDAERREASDGDLALLSTYARRAVALLERLGSVEAPDVALRLGPLYGDAGDVSMHEAAITAGFAACLPVWPEWVAQLFERQATTPEGGTLVTRELSYRFRVNGRVPQSRASAFAVRLDRLERGLLGDEPRRVRRNLAELAFLAAVVPSGERDDPSGSDALPSLETTCRRLEQGGRAAIEAVLGDLRRRERAMDRIGSALIGLLRTAGSLVTKTTQARTWDYYLNVMRSLLDPQRIASPLDDPLSTPTTWEDEQVGFFGHVRVTADRAMPGSLFSARVRVRLSERSLRLAGEPQSFEVERELPARLVPVAWRPYRLDAARERWIPAAPADGPWLVPGRLEVRYDPTTLGDPKKRDAESLLGLAATRTAFAILAYVTLARLFARAGRVKPALSMLRLHGGSREAEPLSGEEGLYAAAQAVELALGRDLDVRMQGLVLDDAAATDRFKREGTFGALLAGFPLRVAHDADPRPVVGVITFGARPCNAHPDEPDGAARQLFVTRTYLAAPSEAPLRGYAIQALGSRTEIDAAGTPLPHTLLEEIRRLYDLHGCGHILLLAHRYGERRVGRSAGAARLHAQGHLLREVAEAFPNLVLYPLIRDTFPATRMRLRGKDEHAFEILEPDEHLHAAPEATRALRQEYTPVYSLATLHVVGESPATPKPQSGFCTYFLLRDAGSAPIEVAERLRANLLLTTSPVRPSLVAVLRGIHYLEAERSITPSRTAQPVLDPYDWLVPDRPGKLGEIVVFERSRRRPGSVALSLPAVLDAISRILHATPEGAARRGG